MRRSMASFFFVAAVIASCAGLSLLTARPAAAEQNVTFNFNQNDGGWTGSSDSPGALWWMYDPNASSSGGGWDGTIKTPSVSQRAYLESPCLELVSNDPKPLVHVDFSHFYNFARNNSLDLDLMQGQVQFNYARQNEGWNGWQAVPSLAWLTDSTHIPPTDTGINPPLVAGSPVFAGQSQDFDVHIQSGFDLQWQDYDLSQLDEIKFRFVLATVGQVGTTEDLLQWEIDSFKIQNVRLCAAVPEIDPATGGSALSLIAGVLAMSERRCRRALAPTAA